MEPYQHARALLGVKHAHMGRSENGLDCVGLLWLTGQRCGLDFVDSPHYGRQPGRDNDSFGLRGYLVQNFGEPVTRDPQPNDVLLLRLGRFPSHVALVAPNPHGLSMIHTHHRSGRVVEHRIDARWQKRIVEVFGWPAKR